MKIELNNEEAVLLQTILEKQTGNTQWVIDNKEPVNKDDLQARVDVMNKVIIQIDKEVKQNDK